MVPLGCYSEETKRERTSDIRAEKLRARSNNQNNRSVLLKTGSCSLSIEIKKKQKKDD